MNQRPDDSFAQLLQRLSAASVRQRWEAYRDVDWDDAAHGIDPEDPRWEAPSWDPLGASPWYRDQAPVTRYALGLYRVAAFLKVGIEFERTLSEGLSRFAASLPNGHPAFRYVHHEITEEAQHSMMFQEFINRSGLDPPGAPGPIRALYERVAQFSADLQVLFFLAALGGEEAFDYVQRRTLAGSSTHPLLRRISRIHVAEEARHLSFARAFLRDAVPRLDNRSMRRLRYQAPVVVAWTARHMFEVPDSFVTDWGMPSDVRSGIADGTAAGDVHRESMTRIASLCHEVGLVDTRLDSAWSGLGAPRPG